MGEWEEGGGLKHCYYSKIQVIINHFVGKKAFLLLLQVAFPQLTLL